MQSDADLRIEIDGSPYDMPARNYLRHLAISEKAADEGLGDEIGDLYMEAIKAILKQTDPNRVYSDTIFENSILIGKAEFVYCVLLLQPYAAGNRPLTPWDELYNQFNAPLTLLQGQTDGIQNLANALLQVLSGNAFSEPDLTDKGRDMETLLQLLENDSYLTGKFPTFETPTVLEAWKGIANRVSTQHEAVPEPEPPALQPLLTEEEQVSAAIEKVREKLLPIITGYGDYEQFQEYYPDGVGAYYGEEWMIREMLEDALEAELSKLPGDFTVRIEKGEFLKRVLANLSADQKEEYYQLTGEFVPEDIRSSQYEAPEASPENAKVIDIAVWNIQEAAVAAKQGNTGYFEQYYDPDDLPWATGGDPSDYVPDMLGRAVSAQLGHVSSKIGVGVSAEGVARTAQAARARNAVQEAFGHIEESGADYIAGLDVAGAPWFASPASVSAMSYQTMINSLEMGDLEREGGAGGSLSSKLTPEEIQQYKDIVNTGPVTVVVTKPDEDKELKPWFRWGQNMGGDW
jgi:hypothetical protein